MWLLNQKHVVLDRHTKLKGGRLKMQDVCPEVVADADDMLSGEDHVESRC